MQIKLIKFTESLVELNPFNLLSITLKQEAERFDLVSLSNRTLS